jgi:hypothetical protein
MDSRLFVLDLDGPKEMVYAWFASRPAMPKTWQVRTGSGGLHIWFRYPDWLRGVIPNCQLWRGDGKHQEIAVLGNRKLASCPPTQYGNGNRYRWCGSINPLKSKCAVAPQWLLQEIFEQKQVVKQKEISQGRRFENTFFAPSDEIPEKLQVLVKAGLRLAQAKPNESGWISCYRPGDPNDKRPSASVRQDGSCVWVAGHGVLDFWSALVALGAFPNVETAVAVIRGQI